jgi:diguanylate cyclase (GGDEF)-like protein
MKHNNYIVHSDVDINLPRLGDFRKFNSVLIQIFAATSDLGKVRELLALITDYLPDAVIIGVSSDGTIDQGELHEYGSVIQVSVSGFDKSYIKLAFTKNNTNSFQSGREIAENICVDNTKVVIAFSEASSINGEEFLEGIYSVNKHIIVSGGVASTPTFTDTFVIAGGKVLTSGAVAVSISGDKLQACRDHTFGWQPVGKKMKITEAQGNHIKSIDNKTPCEVFKHYLGDDVIDAMPGLGSAFPLMIKRGQSYIARGIIALDGEHFIVSGNVKENDTVYIGYGNPYNITHQNKLTDSILHSINSPEVIFSYYCEGRRLFLPDDMVNYELEALGQASSVCGCFTLGEFYTEKQYLLLNFSSTLLALSEREKATNTRGKTSAPELVQNEFGVVSEKLFHLIDTRTKELQHLAYHDELTGLPNRAYFREILDMTILSSIKRNKVLSVMFVDVDNFRKVNDTHGHAMSDRLLIEIANAIAKKLKPDDILARCGGKDFLVMHCDSSNHSQVKELVSDILLAFEKPFIVDEKSFALRASIGVCEYPKDGTNQDTLIENADATMCDVKHAGNNNFAFYHPGIVEKSIQKATMEEDLRKALDSDELVVFYQPQIDLKTGKIVSAEALVRWNHPEKGLIFPDEFIEIAEETELIYQLSEMMFDKALGQMRKWLDCGMEISKISVNVSAKQFIHDDMLLVVSRYLNKYALPPKCLDIEINEFVIMSNTEKIHKRLVELQHFGVTISIDNFGTDYLSLSYLKRFKVNTLKIDRSVAIIALAQSLNLDIVAEGVETSEQERFLIDQNCTLAQGNYYSRAIPVSEFEDLYKNREAG